MFCHWFDISSWFGFTVQWCSFLPQPWDSYVRYSWITLQFRPCNSFSTFKSCDAFWRNPFFSYIPTRYHVRKFTANSLCTRRFKRKAPVVYSTVETRCVIDSACPSSTPVSEPIYYGKWVSPWSGHVPVVLVGEWQRCVSPQSRTSDYLSSVVSCCFVGKYKLLLCMNVSMPPLLSVVGRFFVMFQGMRTWR